MCKHLNHIKPPKNATILQLFLPNVLISNVVWEFKYLLANLTPINQCPARIARSFVKLEAKKYYRGCKRRRTIFCSPLNNQEIRGCVLKNGRVMGVMSLLHFERNGIGSFFFVVNRLLFYLSTRHLWNMVRLIIVKYMCHLF